MTIPEITYREILDSEGNFRALEIRQLDQRIVIEFKKSAFTSQAHPHYWETMKETIDKIQQRVNKQVIGELLEDA